MRKTPYHHKVGGHYRQGKWIENYERGKGGKPSNPSKRSRRVRNPGLKVNVSYYFADGPSETYNVDAMNPTDAVRESIPRIQQPKIPIRAQLRRSK